MLELINLEFTPTGVEIQFNEGKIQIPLRQGGQILFYKINNRDKNSHKKRQLHSWRFHAEFTVILTIYSGICWLKQCKVPKPISNRWR
jgi:hypothetical protein